MHIDVMHALWRLLVCKEIDYFDITAYLLISVDN